jgi:cell division protein YceG involved in septum cleavage
MGVVLLVLALVGAAAWWVDHPLSLDKPSVDLGIEPGTSARGVAQVVAQSGVDVTPQLLYAWFRASGQGRQIKAGSYEVEAGTTPRSLLRKLVRGEESLRSLTLVEGWNFRQVRGALAGAPQLAQESAGLSEAALMVALGRPGLAAEGRFFPDTYSYAKGSSDLKVLARALRAMDKHLIAAWENRAADSPLKNPEQALVLGSIVEKETPAIRPADDRRGICEPPAPRDAASDRSHGDLRHGRQVRREPAQEGPADRHALEHLHPQWPAANPDCDARQTGFDSGRGALANRRFVLRRPR